GGTPVCILGETVRSQLFGTGNPVGDAIRLGRMSCTIIGVLEAKGTSGFGQDQDNVVLVPVTTYQRRIAGNRNIDNIYVSAAEGADTGAVLAEIEAILRQTR